jgi:hypothetical protein
MMDNVSRDPAAMRRVIGLGIVIVLVAGVVASGGFTLHIQVGNRDATQTAIGGLVGEGGAAPAGASGASGGTRSGSALPSAQLSGADDLPDGSSALDDGGTSSSGASGSGVSGGGPAPAGQPASAATPACEGAALRATDHGVSDDSIKIALQTVNLANLTALGFGLSTGEVDWPRIMQAWVNALNADGGVACRNVTFIHHETELSVEGQLASCKYLTQDEKVHAILTPGGLVAGAPCITKDNKTPLVTALAAPEHWSREGAPYLWDVLMSQERILSNHVEWLHQSKTINPKDHHVGVVYANENYSGITVEETMIPQLKARGYKVRAGKLPYDAEQAAAQMAQVVLDFQRAGVNHVVMPVNIIYKTQFMQQAERQAYFPDYSENDATVGCQDALTGTYPERSWDGTPCVSTGLLNGAPNGLRPNELQGYFQQHPFAQRADAVYNATHPGGYSNGGQSDADDTLAQQNANYLVGSLISLWAQAAQRVGPELTRPAWGAAMEQTGAFDQTVSPVPYTYGKGKTSGPDHYEIVRWRAAAGDGYDARRYRRESDRIKARY